MLLLRPANDRTEPKSRHCGALVLLVGDADYFASDYRSAAPWNVRAALIQGEGSNPRNPGEFRGDNRTHDHGSRTSRRRYQERVIAFVEPMELPLRG